MAVEKKKPEAPLSDKKKALETAISQIEKNFGKGTVMRLGDRPEMNVEAIPTGSLAPPVRRRLRSISWRRRRSAAVRLRS